MKQLHYIFIHLVLISTLLGCSGSDGAVDESIDPEFSYSDFIDQASIELSNVDGANQNIAFVAPDSWSASVTYLNGVTGWLELSSMSGEAGSRVLSISTPTLNQGIATRYATIRIETSLVYDEIEIMQGGGVILEVTPIYSYISASGGVVSFDLSTNLSYEVSIPNEYSSWIELQSSDDLSFYVSENPGVELRIAWVSILAGGVSKMVEIRQGGTSYLDLNFSVLPDISYDGDEFMLQVSSSDEWYVDEIPNWIYMPKSSGDSGETYVRVVVFTNPNESSRDALLTFKSGEIERSLAISQVAAPEAIIPNIELSINALLLSASGGTRIVEVQSNSYWWISSMPSWVTISTESGDAGSTSIELYIESNLDSVRREGEVKFETDGVVQSLLIEQEALDSSVIPTPDPDTPFVATIEVDNSAYDISSRGAIVFVTVTSNYYWDVVELPDWTIVNKTSGSGDDIIQLTILYNSLPVMRSGVMTIQCDEITVEISITQAAQ